MRITITGSLATTPVDRDRYARELMRHLDDAKTHVKEFHLRVAWLPADIVKGLAENASRLVPGTWPYTERVEKHAKPDAADIQSEFIWAEFNAPPDARSKPIDFLHTISRYLDGAKCFPDEPKSITDYQLGFILARLDLWIRWARSFLVQEQPPAKAVDSPSPASKHAATDRTTNKRQRPEGSGRVSMETENPAAHQNRMETAREWRGTKGRQSRKDFCKAKKINPKTLTAWLIYAERKAELHKPVVRK